MASRAAPGQARREEPRPPQTFRGDASDARNSSATSYLFETCGRPPASRSTSCRAGWRPPAPPRWQDHSCVTEDERGGSIVQAFRLTYDVQAGVSGAREAIARLRAEAVEKHWDDLERACVFGEAVAAWIAGEDGAAAGVEELIERSSEAGDNVMLALGLALRSDQGFAGTDLLGTAAYDADLARSVVMLETETARPCERISAHTACAIALGNRWLFELATEQYELALAAGRDEPKGSVDFLLAPIRFNLAEQQVSWASKLYELGDESGLEERWMSWNQVVAATEDYPMNDSWRIELNALGLVLKGLAGYEVADDAEALLAGFAGEGEDEGRSAGLLRLAIALDAAIKSEKGSGPADVAAEAIRVAREAISPTVHPFMYDLALFLAARSEAGPGSDSGLRYAERAVEEQWTKRDAALRSMLAQIAAVRVETERDLLSRHARLDDLTGIANRRALEEFLEELIRRGSERCAVVLFDVDSFKAVNDIHGHLAGDRVLVRVAQVLAAGIRTSDLAVRLGGDEFAVILADVDEASAKSRAEALITALDEEPLGDISKELSLRISAGVAVGAPTTILELWGAADAALYQAKASGGHSVRLAEI